MKVLFDVRMLNMSGIGRYIRELLAKARLLDGDLRLTLMGDPQQIEAFLAQEGHVGGPPPKVVSFAVPIYSLAEQVSGSYLMWQHGRAADVCHFPHYSVPYVVPKRTVVTVHDLTHFKFPEYFGRLKVEFARLAMANVVSKAKRIITVSRATANDLEELFPKAKGKIRVVHNGVSAFWRPLAPAELAGLEEIAGTAKYFLYVGNRKPHKNLARLLSAYSRLEKEEKTIGLVIAGASFSADDEVTRLKRRLGLRNLVEIQDASDETLRKLYNGALALTMPSLYEGFGLPVLEAMACGTPVITSNVSSLPEVAGEAALYVDPYGADSIYGAMARLLNDHRLREELARKGLERARQFTWEDTARKTLAVYREVLAEGE